MKRAALPKATSAAMLTHFTRASHGATALDNLFAILGEGVIHAADRMVRGTQATVCMFDAPLVELRHLLGRRNRRRYEPFGIALDKRYAFAMGARPAVYLPWREARQLLPTGELWRVVRLEMDRVPPVDWSHEREWRMAGDLRLDPALTVALVQSWRDADAIFEHFGGHPPCAGVIPLKELFGTA